MLYISKENISDIVQIILSYTPESAVAAGDSSVLKSPFKLNPGARVELRTCSQLVWIAIDWLRAVLGMNRRNYAPLQQFL